MIYLYAALGGKNGGSKKVVKAVGNNAARTGAKNKPSQRVQITQQKAANTRKNIPINKPAMGKAATGSSARASRAANRSAVRSGGAAPGAARVKQPVIQPPQRATSAPAPKKMQQQQQAAPAKSMSAITVALQTANSIAVNRAHPRQTDVIDLLRTREKGWIDDKRFQELLRGLVF